MRACAGRNTPPSRLQSERFLGFDDSLFPTRNDDHSREELQVDLQIPLPRGWLLCEGLQPREASGYRCPESPGYKAHAELQIQGIHSQNFRLDALLYLTNDGIEFLRNYLNLPSEIVPATLKKSVRPAGRPMGGGPPGDHPRGPLRFEGDRPLFGGDRDGYRGGPRGPPGEFGGDKGRAPPEFQPSFRGPGGRPGFRHGGGGFGAGPGSSSLSLVHVLVRSPLILHTWALVSDFGKKTPWILLF
ncbi:uncharacterized protein LOC131239074 [Magnolia sinica]|uniref:uncharacterized protein LOC131239074 n=1 Tax=Magnolia sinica TaxID=86752 RepID=UPI002658D6FF|nr:uncharacterized protein LOC131239074 [Magnolia sinica]